MSEPVLVLLASLVKQRGDALVTDDALLRNLLGDLNPSNTDRWKIRVLVQIVQEGIAREIRFHSSGQIDPLVFRNWVYRFQTSTGLAGDRAEWGIRCWMEALGKNTWAFIPPVGTSLLPHLGMTSVAAGEFLMGSDEAAAEKPHRVELNAFQISRYPVTNAEYRAFVDATRNEPPAHWLNGQPPNGKENHPVVHVTFSQAVAYAQWAGGRLPTEAEWEKAASWNETKRGKYRYPWGNDFEVYKCNTRESGIGDTTPVGAYSPNWDSPCGAGDMGGNVWEWCADWYEADYYARSSAHNPQGPLTGQYRVVRGGAWRYSKDFARTAARGNLDPNTSNDSTGFRIAN